MNPVTETEGREPQQEERVVELRIALPKNWMRSAAGAVEKAFYTAVGLPVLLAKGVDETLQAANKAGTEVMDQAMRQRRRTRPAESPISEEPPLAQEPAPVSSEGAAPVVKIPVQETSVGPGAADTASVTEIKQPTTEPAMEVAWEAEAEEPKAPPFQGYDDLSADQIIEQLDAMDEAALREMRAYETRHEERVTVLDAIDERLANK